jgi:hypothetical protein
MYVPSSPVSAHPCRTLSRLALVVCFALAPDLTITVSNTRCNAPMKNPEEFFIPFKGTFEGTTQAEGWTPIQASPTYVTAMRQLWWSSLQASAGRTRSPHVPTAVAFASMHSTHSYNSHGASSDSEASGGVGATVASLQAQGYTMVYPPRNSDEQQGKGGSVTPSRTPPLLSSVCPCCSPSLVHPHHPVPPMYCAVLSCTMGSVL